VVACGTRWGKSTHAVHEAIAALLEPRDRALGWIVAPTYELTRRVFERVVVTLHQYMPHRVKSYDQRGHSIVVTNLGGGTSELRARSADRPAGLLGDALDFLIVDECTEIREDTWSGYLAARLVDRHGTALLISTPTNVHNWFYGEFRRARTDPEYASFAMPTATNPHIDPARIEAERTRLTPEQFASDYLAEFQGLDVTPCTTCGGPDVHAIAATSLHGAERPRLCPACGLMVHEDGKTAVSVQGWSGENKLYSMVMVFVDETTDEDMKFPEYCRVIWLCPSPENPEELPPGCE
jgi:hypothetical protein